MPSSLPPGARVVPLNDNDGGGDVHRHRGRPQARTAEAFSRAAPPLAALRAERLVPDTTHRAQLRVHRLKGLFARPMAELKKEHDDGIRDTVQRLRLTKSVRNVKIANNSSRNCGGGGGSSVVGALCMPFSACCALPSSEAHHQQQQAQSVVVTGAVDGLLTAWDVAACAPLASVSSCDGNQWGRVRSLASYSSDGGYGARHLFFSTTMFDRRISAWSLEETGTAGNSSDGRGEKNSWRIRRVGGTAVAEDTQQQHQHIANINQLAVDPTGSLLASTSDDATLRLWDARTLAGGLTRALGLHSNGSSSGEVTAGPLPHLCTQDGYEGVGPVYGLAFHPDGSLLSTTDAGGRVVTWDTRTGKHAFTTVSSGGGGGWGYGGHLGKATCVTWSPCGVRLASGGADTVIQIWDARMLHKANGNNSNSSSGDGTSTGSPTTTTATTADPPLAPFQLLGHGDVVTSLSFYAPPQRANGSSSSLLPLALLSTSLDGTVRLWDADTGLCAATLTAGCPVYSHCLPPPIRPTVNTNGDDGNGGEEGNTPAAIFTVGHSKYWALWDLLPGDGADGNAAAAATGVRVTETETVVDAKSGVAQAGKDLDGHGSEDDGDEEEEEDEMAALKKGKPAATVAAPAKAASNEESDDDEDDEMEILRNKAKR